MPTAKSQQPVAADADAATTDETPDPRDARIADLERQLEESRRRPTVVGAQESATSVRLKVEPPHSEMHYAGRVLSTEYTEVPASQVAAFFEAAADSGVTLTQDQES